MKGSTRLLVIMAAATSLTACDLSLDVRIEADDHMFVEGAGESVTQTWQVEDFDAVQVEGIGHVIITETGRETLSITGEKNILSQLVVEVRDGALVVGQRPRVDLHPNRDLIIKIEVKELGRIGGAGAVSFKVVLDWEESLFVTLSGACTIEAAGTVDVLDLRASGVTRFRGQDLISRVAYLSVSGVAGAVVWATERLEATASGVSFIRYIGSPELHVSISGLASVGPY